MTSVALIQAGGQSVLGSTLLWRTGVYLKDRNLIKCYVTTLHFLAHLKRELKEIGGGGGEGVRERKHVGGSETGS